MFKYLVLALVAATTLAGCGQAVTAERISQINDALHAYPDVAEAWAFMPLDASVYAEQRFGVGRPTWLLMHVEKQGVASENAPAGEPTDGQ